MAFFIMGAALIALGVFISSLTDNQGFAAGIGIAVILLNYYSVSLSEYVSSSALGSAIALCVIIIALCAVISHITKNENLAYMIAFALIAALLVVFYVDINAFEGLLPSIMVNTQHEVNSITACENFVLGFRLGARIMVECMDEDDGNTQKVTDHA